MVFQILGVAAEYERAMIADRTKKALAAKKVRGERVGRTSILDLTTVNTIKKLRSQKLSFASIADELNNRSIKRGQGGAAWYASTVRAVLYANGGDVLSVMPKPGRKAA
jgi:DNA invertase Pin-like site-specific DNA recombinase